MTSSGNSLCVLYKTLEELCEPLDSMKSICIDRRNNWVVPESFRYLKKLGSGSYGCVASFEDAASKTVVAVKRIGDAFRDLVDAKRILREITILRQIRHENIISILNIFPPKSPDFEDVYIVSEFMETDLSRVIQSDQTLTDEHHRHFLFQIIRAVYYLHSANIIHRDLKPSNILVNSDCTIKLCDFGLARGLENDGATLASKIEVAGTGAEAVDDPASLTEYVVTRWYRSPEVMLYPQNYGRPVDMWSVGCIFAELLGRKTLFQGSDRYDQLYKIASVLGCSKPSDFGWLPLNLRENAMEKYFKHAPPRQVKLRELFPVAHQDAVDLLSRLLRMNPLERLTAQEALEHPYLAYYHRQYPEWRSSRSIDWSFDDVYLSKRLLQNRVYEEIARFHPAVLQRDAALLVPRGIYLEMILKRNFPSVYRNCYILNSASTSLNPKVVQRWADRKGDSRHGVDGHQA